MPLIPARLPQRWTPPGPSSRDRARQQALAAAAGTRPPAGQPRQRARPCQASRGEHGTAASRPRGGGSGHGEHGRWRHHGHAMGDMAWATWRCRAGLPMADRGEDRDGLKLDQLHVPLGPVLPDWPAGLVVRVTLQGDVVQHAEADAVGSRRGRRLVLGRAVAAGGGRGTGYHRGGGAAPRRGAPGQPGPFPRCRGLGRRGRDRPRAPRRHAWPGRLRAARRDAPPVRAAGGPVPRRWPG